jgi:hypothetical protein
MSERQTKQVKHFYSSPGRSDWMPERLSEALRWMLELYESVPEEFQESATIDIDANDDYDDGVFPTIEVFYERPETDGEIELRLHMEKLAKMTADEKREDEERLALRRLFGKYLCTPASQRDATDPETEAKERAQLEMLYQKYRQP